MWDYSLSFYKIESMIVYLSNKIFSSVWNDCKICNHYGMGFVTFLRQYYSKSISMPFFISVFWWWNSEYEDGMMKFIYSKNGSANKTHNDITKLKCFRKVLYMISEGQYIDLLCIFQFNYVPVFSSKANSTSMLSIDEFHSRFSTI